MPTPTRRRLRHARRGVGYFIAIALVLVALVIGVASQLLPLAERYPDRIAAWLSQRAGRPVAFDKLETRWTRRGPLLRLDGLRVGGVGERDPVAFGDAEMLVSLYAGLLPDTPFTELRLHGLALTLERGSDGRWQVLGLPGQQRPGGDPLAVLEGLGELQVVDGRLRVIAPGLGIDAVLPRIDLRLQVAGDRVRAGLRAWMGEPRSDARSAIQARLDFDRHRGNGRAWVGSDQVDLGAWSSLLQFAGIGVAGGHGHGQAWLALQDHRVVGLTVDADFEGLHLQGAPLRVQAGAVTRPRADFQRVRVQARWAYDAEGWRLDAPILRFTRQDGQTHTLDGLLMAGGERYALLAERLELGPLLEVAALSNRLALPWRRWLVEAKPQLVLHDVEVAGRRNGRLRVDARVERVAIAAVGDAPGLDGLAGQLHGDARGVLLALDPSSPTRVDWPRGFGVTHEVSLDGDIVGWRAPQGWHLATPVLHVQGKQVAADLRGGLLLQGDGTRPRIDLVAALEQAPVVLANQFMIRHKMPAAALDWLDAALQGGRVHDARVLVSGDLDDWPFRGSASVPAEGVFHARARISDGVIKFHPDWPAIEQIQADVEFVGDGFDISGSGVVGGVVVKQFDAGIEHFGQARLQVAAQADSDAAKLLTLLRDSPLHARYREVLDSLAASGPARVDFTLDKILRRDAGKAKIAGTLELDGITLEDKRRDLVFEQVRGQVTYDETGFLASELDVRHDARPGQLSLRAGRFTNDREQAFVAELKSSFSARELLARAPRLDWLQPHVDGRSQWTVEVAIPAATGAQGAQPASVRLRSDLAGTSLDLPEPLRKAAAGTLPATVEVSLPLQRGQVRVALGKTTLRLRASSQGDKTGIRVGLGVDSVAPPPASGLVVAGQAERLDAIDWIALAAAADGSGTGLPLRSIDVTARRLRLLGGVFADTRVQVSPVAAGGMTVRATGAALQGSLTVPEADAATVSGNFARVHWRSAATGTADSGAAPEHSEPAKNASDDAMDPSRIPPLAIDVDDFRIGDAVLGSAHLRTQPVAAGLRVEQLQTRSADQRIDITGNWLMPHADVNAGNATTRVVGTIDSDDFGALLDGFGFGGRLAGGEGRVDFKAGWAGSPADFKLADVEGNLVFNVDKGRLLKVEPGAGRLLGLLSIAELPRRLSLDFRDIFSEGFAFNSIDGTLNVAAGKARSDNLEIDGPSATILIRGAANLRKETFNQTIKVLPKTGNMLTAVGAIAAGPVGAAIGAVANAVLSKPLGQAAAKTYRVTGPWQQPQVQVLDDGQLPAPATDTPTVPDSAAQAVAGDTPEAGTTPAGDVPPVPDTTVPADAASPSETTIPADAPPPPETTPPAEGSGTQSAEPLPETHLAAYSRSGRSFQRNP